MRSPSGKLYRKGPGVSRDPEEVRFIVKSSNFKVLSLLKDEDDANVSKLDEKAEEIESVSLLEMSLSELESFLRKESTSKELKSLLISECGETEESLKKVRAKDLLVKKVKSYWYEKRNVPETAKEEE